jgi:2-iminobutanoate/2-iminopropanoate deaminase
MNKIIINTPHAPTPIGPYSQAVKTGNLIFISGQIALNPITNSLKNETIDEETTQIMENLEAILKSQNADFNNVVKTSIFLSDMEHFEKVNQVYEKYFTGEYPARETVAVKGLPRNVHVEISMIASL